MEKSNLNNLMNRIQKDRDEMAFSEIFDFFAPKINAYLGTIEYGGNYMWAVSSVVSATAPLFMIIWFFQRQLISGLTAGAVKG